MTWYRHWRSWMVLALLIIVCGVGFHVGGVRMTTSGWGWYGQMALVLWALGGVAKILVDEL